MKGKKFTRRDFLRMSAMTTAGLVVAARSEPTVAAPLAQDKVKLTAWFSDRRTINEMTAEVIKSEFEVRNPDIEVEVVFVPEPEIPPKMATAYAAGLGPDVSSLDETQVPGFMQQEFIHPIPEEVINVAEEMGSLAADLYKIPPGPAYYALPNGCMTSALFYNADLLQELGYTPEDIPGKWDDFIKWAKDLTIWEGDEIKQWGFTFVTYPWLWDAVAYQNGSFLFKNNKESMLDDPLNVEAWQFILDLMDVHKLDYRFAPLTNHDRMAQGMAVTCFNWTWCYGFLVNEYPDVNWGTLPLPTSTGEPPYGRSSDDVGFCVTTQKEDQDGIDATWKLFRYLVGPDYQRRYVVLRGLQPSLLELREEEQFSGEDPKWTAIDVQTRPGNFRTDGHWTAEITPLMWQDAWERIVNQGEPIEAVLQEHKAKIDELLAEANLPDTWLFGKDGWKTEWETA